MKWLEFREGRSSRLIVKLFMVSLLYRNLKFKEFFSAFIFKYIYRCIISSLPKDERGGADERIKGFTKLARKYIYLKKKRIFIPRKLRNGSIRKKN